LLIDADTEAFLAQGDSDVQVGGIRSEDFSGMLQKYMYVFGLPFDFVQADMF